MDLLVGQIADGQRGLITRSQLLAAGLSAKAIHRRCRRGSLRVVHRGVYAVGHVALPEYGAELAAVLSCGPHAVLSHGSAAALWGMCPRPSAEIEVIVIGRHPGVRDGVRIHRVRDLDPIDCCKRDGIPLTSPARTLIDLAASRTSRELERAFDEGRIRGLVSPKALSAALVRYPGRRGAAVLAELADASASATRTTLTASHPEEVLLAALRRVNLPRPECNARIGRYTVDFYWRAQGVVVEVDGYRFHSTRGAFERDHAKDRDLRGRRLTPLRYTAREVEHELEAILVEVATTLARAAPAA